MRPATGQSFALVLPAAPAAAVQAFPAQTLAFRPDRFGMTLATNGRAVMVADQAGRRAAHALAAPGNVALVRLPPHSPKLNPVERAWLRLRKRRPSHRVPNGHGATVDALCPAWNQLTPERLSTLASHPHLNHARI